MDLNLNYKPSRYNIWHHGENGVYLYNVYSTGLLELEEPYISRLKEVMADPGLFSRFSESERSMLIGNGFFIESGVNELDMVRYRYRKSAFNHANLAITLIPTKGCNLACEYCFEQNKNSARMSDADCDEIMLFFEKELNEVKPAGFHIFWYGGEPLLALDVVEKLCNRSRELCEKLKIPRNPDVMITNGYLLDEETAARLKGMGVGSVQISLDGDREEHNKRRVLPDGSGTFDRLREAIDIACRHFTRVAVRINTNKDNLPGIRRMLEQDPVFRADNVDVNIGPLKTYLGGSISRDRDIACFNGPELQKVQSEVDRMLGKQSRKAEEQGPYNFVIKGNNCGADQLKNFVIGPGALVYKCYERVDPGEDVGSIQKGLFTPNHNLWKWAINEPFEHAVCRECAYLPTCMGGCPSARWRLGLPNSESCGYWEEWHKIKFAEIDRAHKAG